MRSSPDRCRIKMADKERTDTLTVKALDVGMRTTSETLAALEAQAHASIQDVERRRKPRPKRKGR